LDEDLLMGATICVVDTRVLRKGEASQVTEKEARKGPKIIIKKPTL
jgi:hypothetical protein